MTKNIIQIIFKTASALNIPAVIIGGLALPAYNVSRSTIDIDICIYVETQEILDQFIENLKKNNIKSLQSPKIDHNLFTVFGENNEAEIWLKPCSTFNWDKQMSEKRRLFSSYVYVLAIEDFILTKLARDDRSSIDIDDIMQVMIANKSTIDWEYLHYRLRWKDLIEDFKNILKVFKADLDKNMREISKDILEKFRNNN